MLGSAARKQVPDLDHAGEFALCQAELGVRFRDPRPSLGFRSNLGLPSCLFDPTVPRYCPAVFGQVIFPCVLYLIEYNRGMRTTSYTDLRKNLASMLDSVTEDHAPMLITRDKGKPAAVLMSLEDYASYEETRYLLRNPRNADRLLKAVVELDEGKGTERVLAE